MGPDDLDELIAEMGERDDKFTASLRDAEIRSALLRSLIGARHAADLTQATVAETMGTTQSAISELEGGTSDPRLSTLQRYARAVNRAIVVVVSPHEVAAGVSKVVDLPLIRGSFARNVVMGANVSPKPELVKYARVAASGAAEEFARYHRRSSAVSATTIKELAS